MSITFSSICKNINHSELVIMTNPEKVLLNFWAMLPPHSRKELSSDYLYAFKASSVKKYKNNLQNMSLLIYEDVPIPQEYYHISGLNLLVTKDADTFEDLKLEIQQIFDFQAKINNYAYQLMSLCHLNANIKQLLDEGYRFLNNPMLLVDTSLALIDSVGVYSSIDDPVLKSTIETGHLPEHFLNGMLSEHIPESHRDNPDILIFREGAAECVKTPIIAGRIIRGNQLLGYLKLFEYNHKVTDLEKNALAILCDFLSIALTDSRAKLSSSNQQIEDFMVDLLNQKITSPEAINARADLYHLNIFQKIYVISIKYNIQKSAIDRLYFFKKQLQNMFNSPCVTFYNQLIVALIPTDSFSTISKQLKTFLQANNLTAGVSLPFDSYTDTYRHYMQSLACIEIQSRFNLHDILVDYDDWKFIHLFMHFQECCELKDLIPESIFILQENDAARGTNLTETLFAYIRSCQNITEAANMLHLHYNTMKYRLNQIVDLTGINFNDVNVMFRIIIGEKVMDILNKNFDSLRVSSNTESLSDLNI